MRNLVIGILAALVFVSLARTGNCSIVVFSDFFDFVKAAQSKSYKTFFSQGPDFITRVIDSPLPLTGPRGLVAYIDSRSPLQLIQQGRVASTGSDLQIVFPLSQVADAPGVKGVGFSLALLGLVDLYTEADGTLRIDACDVQSCLSLEVPVLKNDNSFIGFLSDREIRNVSITAPALSLTNSQVTFALLGTGLLIVTPVPAGMAMMMTAFGAFGCLGRSRRIRRRPA